MDTPTRPRCSGLAYLLHLWRPAWRTLASAFVLTALSATNAALAQTVFFDFESAPDAGTPGSAGSVIDPVFIDPGTGFELSHTAGAVRGNTQWDDGGLCTPFSGAGCMRLSDLGVGATPVTATVNFSRSVRSVSLWAAASQPSTITPILAGGGTGTAVAVPSSYGQIVISGEGPYLGLALSASNPNQLQWDDLEVEIAVVKPPRNGLYGASRPFGFGPPFRLLAINPNSAPPSGQVIATLAGVSLSALARQPSTGTLYGMNGFDGTLARFFIVDGRTGSLSGGYPVVTFDAAVDGGTIVGVLGADFAPDGTLYGTVEVRYPVGGDDDVLSFVYESWLAEIPTTPVDIDGEDQIVIELIGQLPQEFTTGLSVNPVDGTVWTVSLGTSSIPNMLRGFTVNGGLTQIAAFTMSDDGDDPPGDGFSSLQFSCGPTPTLYAANLASAAGDDGGQLYTIDTSDGQISPVGGSVTDGDGINSLAPATTCGTTSVQNSPTPTGDDVTVVSIEAFEQVGNVETAGTTNASFCVGPDLRQITTRRGRERYVARPLWLRELAGRGTCTGVIPDSDPAETWEEVLDQIYLRIPPAWRSYKGELVLPGDMTPTEGYWIVVGVVRTTAEFIGPVGVSTFPHALVSYVNTPEGQRPACENDLDWRTIDLGGAVEAFGEFQNVEDDRMIPQTVQCNAPRSMTRRTTHAYPLRLDGSRFDEEFNIHRQLNGILGTIAEASSLCSDSDTLTALSQMQSSLTSARFAIFGRRWEDAIADLEQLARYADDNPSEFRDCGIPANYKGNFVSRGLSAAFTVHDRFLHSGAYVKYFVPADIDAPPLFDPAP